jgi:hypothetical protein
MGWVVSVTPRRALAPRKGTPVPIVQRLGGPRASLDTEATRKIFSPLPGIEPRSPGRPARSQTLYWLSYLAHFRSLHSCIFSEVKVGRRVKLNLVKNLRLHGGLKLSGELKISWGGAMTQAVNHRPLTAETRVRNGVSSCAICGGYFWLG